MHKYLDSATHSADTATNKGRPPHRHHPAGGTATHERTVSDVTNAMTPEPTQEQLRDLAGRLDVILELAYQALGIQLTEDVPADERDRYLDGLQVRDLVIAEKAFAARQV
jgi:hypothetical protein